MDAHRIDDQLREFCERNSPPFDEAAFSDRLRRKTNRNRKQASAPRRRSGLRVAVFASIAVVLVAVLTIGALEAVKHLGKDQPILVITDDTLGSSTPDQTTQTTASIGAQSSVVTPSSEAPKGGLLDPEGNFTLYVSNQSFEIDLVDIAIEIDGQPVLDQDFEVGDQHNWERFTLRLSAGRHTLVARSDKGEATLEQSFEVTGEHWAVVDYWYYTEAYGEPTPKHFEFNIQDSPIRLA